MNRRDEPSSSQPSRKLHGAVGVNLPAANVVEVIRGVRSARLQQHVVGRLHVAGFIGGAAGDDRLAAFPLEWKSEPRVALRQHRSEEHTSELQSQSNLVCRLLLEKTTVSFPVDTQAQRFVL